AKRPSRLCRPPCPRTLPVPEAHWHRSDAPTRNPRPLRPRRCPVLLRPLAMPGQRALRQPSATRRSLPLRTTLLDEVRFGYIFCQTSPLISLPKQVGQFAEQRHARVRTPGWIVKGKRGQIGHCPLEFFLGDSQVGDRTRKIQLIQ